MVGTVLQGIPRRGGQVLQTRYSRQGPRRVGNVATGTYCRDREAHRGDSATGDGVERGSIRGVWFERGGDSADRTGDKVPVRRVVGWSIRRVSSRTARHMMLENELFPNHCSPKIPCTQNNAATPTTPATLPRDS